MLSSPAVLAQFFSAKNVEEMSWYGATATALETATWLQHRGALRSSFSYRLLFEEAYKALAREHRVEYLFKNTILRKLVFGRHSPNTTAFYSEFSVGKARIDAVVANGNVTAYEIKTGHDDFSRARHQVEQYFKCFRLITFVVEGSQVETAQAILPPEVGLLVLTRRNTLRELRPPVARKDLLDRETIFGTLRKGEYSEILTGTGNRVQKEPADTFYFRSRSAFSSLSVEHAQAELENALRHRSPARQHVTLCNELPLPLHLAAFAYKMRKRDWKAIVRSLDAPFPLE